MTKRIKGQFELAQAQINKADSLFDDEEYLPESLFNMFCCMENCANIIKDIFNHFPRNSHTGVNLVLKDLFRRKILKQDYSAFHSALNDYRARAFFGEYSREKKILPPKNSLRIYLVKTKELFNETKKIVEDEDK